MVMMRAEPVFAREEGCVKRARDEGPQGAAAEGVVFQGPADENGRLGDGGGERDRAVVVGLIL
jgi:hypothetical protein